MSDDDGGFLTRWARRKQETRVEPSKDAAAETAASPNESAAPSPLSEAEVAELPDPDSLDQDADFKVFLRDGVPEELKRRALRRLWRINPVFGHLDGLNDYDLDYTDAATVVANLKSLYQVGRGMVVPEDEPGQKEPGQEESGQDELGQNEPGQGVEATEAGAEGGAQTTASGPAAGEAVGADDPVAGETADIDTPPRASVTPSVADSAKAGTVAGTPETREPGTAARRRWGAFVPAEPDPAENSPVERST